MQAHISRLSPAFMKISRGRLFQFALPGVLLPFSHASPAFAPLFKLANRHGQRTPAEPEPMKADLKYVVADPPTSSGNRTPFFVFMKDFT